MSFRHKEVDVVKQQRVNRSESLSSDTGSVCTNTQDCGESVSRRTRDRRNFSFSTLVCGSLHCRRRAVRRSSDTHSAYVDWYEPRLLYITLGVLVLSATDAVMTLNLLQHGSIELNPFMGILIEHDVGLFVFTKLMLTGASLVFLVMHVNFRLFRYIRIKHCITASLLVYLILVAYELVLLSHVVLI